MGATNSGFHASTISGGMTCAVMREPAPGACGRAVSEREEMRGPLFWSHSYQSVDFDVLLGALLSESGRKANDCHLRARSEVRGGMQQRVELTLAAE